MSFKDIEQQDNLVKLSFASGETASESLQNEPLDYLLKDYEGVFDDLISEGLIDNSDNEAFDFELYREALDRALEKEEDRSSDEIVEMGLKKQLRFLHENNKRIKFLLDEIETFLPLKK